MKNKYIQLIHWAHDIFMYKSHFLHQLNYKESTHSRAMSWYTPNSLPPSMFSIVLANSLTFSNNRIYLLSSLRVFTIFYWFFFAWVSILTLSSVGFKSNIFLFGSLSSSWVLLVRIEHKIFGLLAPNSFPDYP